MERNTVFYRNERVVSRKIVDELIDGERTIHQICKVIVEEFEVSTEEAEHDVVEFLEKLVSVGSIEKKT